MGFAVGGVLLAVIIVAFLAIHRNHKQPVAFDPGTANGNADGSADVNGGAPDVGRPTVPTPSDSLSATAAKMTEKGGDPKPPAEAEKADDRWDALFASTGATQNQFTRTGGTSGNGTPAKTAGRKLDAASPKNATPPSDSAGTNPSATLADPTPAPVTQEPRSTSTASETVRTHKIQPNETLSGISKLVYGESRHYKAIETANPGIDATKLKPGTILKIPPLEKAKATEKAAAADATSAADGKTYVVQKDDNLYKITRKLYGNGDKQEQLYEINKQTIGADSTKLKPGMVLKLPAAPAAQ
jgi:nucleoid-associated protein YgaU